MNPSTTSQPGWQIEAPADLKHAAETHGPSAYGIYSTEAGFWYVAGVNLEVFFNSQVFRGPFESVEAAKEDCKRIETEGLKPPMEILTKLFGPGVEATSGKSVFAGLGGGAGLGSSASRIAMLLAASGIGKPRRPRKSVFEKGELDALFAGRPPTDRVRYDTYKDQMEAVPEDDRLLRHLRCGRYWHFDMIPDNDENREIIGEFDTIEEAARSADFHAKLSSMVDDIVGGSGFSNFFEELRQSRKARREAAATPPPAPPVDRIGDPANLETNLGLLALMLRGSEKLEPEDTLGSLVNGLHVKFIRDRATGIGDLPIHSKVDDATLEPREWAAKKVMVERRSLETVLRSFMNGEERPARLWQAILGLEKSIGMPERPTAKPERKAVNDPIPGFIEVNAVFSNMVTPMEIDVLAVDAFRTHVPDPNVKGSAETPVNAVISLSGVEVWVTETRADIREAIHAARARMSGEEAGD